MQTTYDTKLNNATYDALKAFQLNTINSSTSDLSNSKMRDIEASVNSFFNSVASNFNMAGYNRDILKEYVPALVYTMYDGYYIYSPYTNTLSDEDYNSNSTYKNEEKISGLKPYIYYSCRYKKGDDDFVITYSLDNYITIYGRIKGKEVYDSGYLINDCSADEASVKYRGISIETENLKEKILGKEYTYTKINGVKYYYDNNNEKWFSILNGEKNETTEKFDETNYSAIKYYTEAAKFKDKIINEYGLDKLKTSDAVYLDGKKIENDKTLSQQLNWRRL